VLGAGNLHRYARQRRSILCAHHLACNGGLLGLRGPEGAQNEKTAQKTYGFFPPFPDWNGLFHDQQILLVQDKLLGVLNSG
jgi:hypothetical protein